MRIWITGGAGFLGQRLTKQLRNDHHIVSLSKRENPSAHESISIDLSTEKAKLETVLGSNQPEVVIHTASRQPGPYDFRDYVKSNLKTTANLLDVLQSSPPNLVIFTSTQSVYPKSALLPFTENHPASSSSPYASTKRWAEQLMEAYGQSNVIVLRLPSLYGLGQGDSFVDGLTNLARANEPIELFSRGEIIRDTLHVSDVVNAIQTCINNPPGEQFTLFNLGCGRAIKAREYAENIVQVFDSKSPIVISDRRSNQYDCYGDITRAKQLIGFTPPELRESLQNYADELSA